MTAADIDAKMVKALNNKLLNHDIKIRSIQAGMLELKEKLHARFDLAFCIGNSLIHLDGKDEIQTFLKSAKQLLKKEGNLIIQIINFDRVLLKDITELPAVTNDEIGLAFERYYRFDKEKNIIFFRTILTVDDKKIENKIPLFPLLSEDAVEMLGEAGFKKVRLFADFNGNDFDKYNSYMLVLQAS